MNILKTTVISVILLLLLLLVSPLFLIKDKAISTMSPVLDMSVKSESAKKTTTFKVKTESGIKEVNARDYILGVLCKEVPPTYEKEALKAQAVAAYTFALNRQVNAKENNLDYDLTDSPKTDQCYADIEKEKENWGDNADRYYKAYATAVDEVLGEYLEYEGAPALTLYHAISPGATNNSKDVFQKELPYLVSVDSVGDKLSPRFLSEVDINEQEVAEKLKDLCEVKTGTNAFSDINTLSNGFVKSVNINGKTVEGRKIAAALSLKSAAFEVEYGGGNYHFTVKGSGHGVGMSEEGALYLAKQGSTYKEILSHYYKGLILKKS